MILLCTIPISLLTICHDGDDLADGILYAVTGLAQVQTCVCVRQLLDDHRAVVCDLNSFVGQKRLKVVRWS
jgi:hypothetical protein